MCNILIIGALFVIVVALLFIKNHDLKLAVVWGAFILGVKNAEHLLQPYGWIAISALGTSLVGAYQGVRKKDPIYAIPVLGLFFLTLHIFL